MAQAIYIVTAAVDRYKELCEGRYTGEASAEFLFLQLGSRVEHWKEALQAAVKLHAAAWANNFDAYQVAAGV